MVVVLSGRASVDGRAAEEGRWPAMLLHAVVRAYKARETLVKRKLPLR